MTRHLEAWKLSGRCASDPNPDAWFDDDRLAVAHAKSVCARCPVQATCLADALARGEQFGVLGGLTGPERRRVGMGPVHGKRGTYAAGCRCDDCEAANTRYIAGWRQRRSFAVTRRGALFVAVLESPAGHGRRRAFPGQLYLDLLGATA